MRAARRFFAPGVVVLLAIMATLEVSTSLEENQSFDEHVHLASGYAYWKAGAYWCNPEHPALIKLLAAVPLLFQNLTLVTESPAWKVRSAPDVGVEFLYYNSLPADRILETARVPLMVLALAFGAAMAWWVRRRFGQTAALAALAFYCLDPNLIAHSRYVTDDVALAGFFFLASVAWSEYLATSKERYLVAASLLCALAAVTKYSGLVLLPIFAVLYAIRWWQTPRGFSLRRAVADAASIGAAILVTILVVYWPDTLRCLRGGPGALASHAYLAGIGIVARMNSVGHDNYLLGRLSTHGWWYYFPVAFAVKSTVASLAAVAVMLTAVVGWWRHSGAPGRWQRLREAPFLWYGLSVPPMLFFGACVASTINIGIRYILPVYLFLYVAASVALVNLPWRFARVLLAALLVIQAAECLSIYPHYLAFFNVLAGGPANGPRYLVDSNIDWGQDVKKLARWLKSRGTDRVYLRYFGSDRMWNEGLKTATVPGTEERAARENVDGFVAVSVTNLMGVDIRGTYLSIDTPVEVRVSQLMGDQPPEHEYAWLRQMTPVAKVGYSIYVYDLRKPHSNAPGP